MWRALVCAIGFLTRLPVPHVEIDDAAVARSAGFFSWVGALIAALLWLGSVAFASLGHRLCALILVALWALITGGLHLDGLADTVDGLGGGRGNRARVLEIMRDSRIGSYGTVALVIALSLKWSALERALELAQTSWLLVPVVSRFLSTSLLATFPYARERGLGRAFSGQVGPREVAIGALVFIPAFAVFHVRFVPAALIGIGCALLLALRARGVLRGLTGDVHGAAIEICEATMLAALPNLGLLAG